MGRGMNDLAMRDPAAAAIFGNMEADFGYNPEFGHDPYGPFGPYSPMGPMGMERGSHGPYAEMGADLYDDEALLTGGTDDAVREYMDLGGKTAYGYEGMDGYSTDFGYGIDGYGTQFGADLDLSHPSHPLHVDNPRVQGIVAKHLAERRMTARRQALLEPNLGSRIKVERYRFALNQNVNVGTASTFTLSGAPDFNLRPQRVNANVNVPGFIYITEGKVANVSFTSGSSIDTWELNPNAVDQMLDVPTLSPANKATVLISSTTLVPSGFTNTSVFTFVVSFTGWSTIAA